MDPGGGMLKKTRTVGPISVDTAAWMGSGPAVDPEVKPIDLLNTLLATGMSVADALDVLREMDPSIAAKAAYAHIMAMDFSEFA